MRLAFIEALFADRTDAATRAAFSDWLEENGENSRASILRRSVIWGYAMCRACTMSEFTIDGPLAYILFGDEHVSIIDRRPWNDGWYTWKHHLAYDDTSDVPPVLLRYMSGSIRSCEDGDYICGEYVGVGECCQALNSAGIRWAKDAALQMLGVDMVC